MTPLEQQLFEALKTSKVKLESFHKQTGGVYGGGPYLPGLMKDIKEALAEYERKKLAEDNDVRDFMANIG